ncbi:MAG: deoxyribodipyrimidine photo-lyase [Kineosporiaceae bacterium]|nr:deoxyribodipyrimidine photo-lyase [Aeromicrobium sp.]
MPTSIMWFRRDLRLADNPALRAAVDAGPDGVVPLFVLDSHLFDSAGLPRQAHLTASLRDLGERVDHLHVVHGDPVEEVVAVARHAGATTVHIAADHTPYGGDRDAKVEKALSEHGVELHRLGSYYAVAPGRVTKNDETSYKVFTPFYRAWQEHRWRDPAPTVHNVPWISPGGRTNVIPNVDGSYDLPAAGEAAARRRWRAFLDEDVGEYDTIRDKPGVDRTSRMSVHLKWGEIHPRTMLADLGRSAGEEAYRRELAFREFYADVLFQRPDSAWGYYDRSFEQMDYDEPGDELGAWKEGRTGFPIVDAGMRQLLGEGWMHNRVRMIVASFLVKDLHLEWQHGARHFAEHLADFDLASNQHGWQWVAGSGTDASPYFRVFNPTTQGKKFDPDGTYVRRWVPELRNVEDKAVHEPWTLPSPPAGYPAPIVDHAEERTESLRRYEVMRGK